ncbi:MAG: hypothetical protein M1418_02805 [Deltaproteobacteria bacterium]|nr:hypothetical protein [Deltaproteobacteria bacterium]
MAPQKTTTPRKKVAQSPKGESDQDTCFVISPIGKPGTEKHTQFKEILDYIIKAAVKASGYNLQVLRADDIDRAGSFIKDILESLYGSYVVIADLTEQNPNVFYELGVRHALSPRTILIAQSVDDIPSDLREYRTIVYDTSAKGAANFSARLKKYLGEMQKDPGRADNPVLDRIGSIFENRIATLEAEKQQLKKDLSTVLQKGAPKEKKSDGPSVTKRIERITKLVGAEREYSGGFKRGDKDYILPYKQGNFDLYFVQEGSKIKEFWYLSAHHGSFNHKDDLADVRVLMQNCINQGGTRCKFIIATNDDLSGLRKEIMAILHKMKSKLSADHRSLFDLEIWDDSGLLEVEKDLGLKVDL